MSHNTASLSFLSRHAAHRGMTDMLAQAGHYVVACWRRDKQRRELTGMDELGRQDIGCWRVRDELAKPFWRE